jgi:Asp-tRNA(Asn)/Glu-tRNA(Gln) amidotransferase A subunit family amidase
MTPYALDFAHWSAEYVYPGAQLEKIEIEAALYPPLGELLEGYDALLCATCGSRGLVAGDDYVDHGLEVGGREVRHCFDSMLTPAFNILSRCPVLVVPGGFADNGLPVGVQIVGRTYDDVTPFRLGAALEQVRPWLDADERRPKVAQAAPAT